MDDEETSGGGRAGRTSSPLTDALEAGDPVLLLDRSGLVVLSGDPYTGTCPGEASRTGTVGRRPKRWTGTGSSGGWDSQAMSRCPRLLRPPLQVFQPAAQLGVLS